MVLLHAAGGQRVDRGRAGQAAVLGDDAGRGVLGDHQARVHPGVGGEEGRQLTAAGHVQQTVDPAFGDRADLRRGDRQEVGGETERGAVEVAGRLDPAVRQHHRVVDDRDELPGGGDADEVERVPRRPGDLRRTPDGICVLHRVGQVVPVRVHDRGVLQQPVDVRGRGGLSRVRPDRVQFGEEGPLRAEHRLGGQRGGHVRHGEQVRRVRDGQQQHAEHPVGAVDQRQPLLGGQLQRAQAGRVQGFGGGHPGAVLAHHPALAEQHDRAVGEGRQVTGGAQRAVFRDPRGDAVIEQVDQALREHRPHPGAAHRERAHPQQHHRPHHLAGHRRADPGGVRADQRVLQLGAAFRFDRRVGERAEAGRHAVDGPAGGFDAVHDGAAGGHRLDGGGGELDLGILACDGEDVGGLDPGGLNDHGHCGTPSCLVVSAAPVGRSRSCPVVPAALVGRPGPVVAVRPVVAVGPAARAVTRRPW